MNSGFRLSRSESAVKIESIKIYRFCVVCLAHNILLKNYLFHKLDAKSGVIVLFGNTDSASKDGYQRHDLDIKFVTGIGVQIFLFS